MTNPYKPDEVAGAVREVLTSKITNTITRPFVGIESVQVRIGGLRQVQELPRKGRCARSECSGRR